MYVVPVGAMHTTIWYRSHPITFSQIEVHLSKSGDWLAGGQGPTAADFMMSFPLETWLDGGSDMLGPKIKDYVKRIHGRYALLVCSSYKSTDAFRYLRLICADQRISG
jgi:hypothetical protein